MDELNLDKYLRKDIKAFFSLQDDFEEGDYAYNIFSGYIFKATEHDTEILNEGAKNGATSVEMIMCWKCQKNHARHIKDQEKFLCPQCYILDDPNL